MSQNRAARRAAARSKTLPELRGFKFGVTIEEASIIEEALALWGVQTRTDWGDVALTPYQQWALERGERLRQAMAAAVGQRPWHDTGAQRVPPATSQHLQTVFDLHAQVPCVNCEDADRKPATMCRSCGHGEADEHYDGTCETVIELTYALKEADRAQQS